MWKIFSRWEAFEQKYTANPLKKIFKMCRLQIPIECDSNAKQTALVLQNVSAKKVRSFGALGDCFCVVFENLKMENNSARWTFSATTWRQYPVGITTENSFEVRQTRRDFLKHARCFNHRGDASEIFATVC